MLSKNKKAKTAEQEVAPEVVLNQETAAENTETAVTASETVAETADVIKEEQFSAPLTADDIADMEPVPTVSAELDAPVVPVQTPVNEAPVPPAQAQVSEPAPEPPKPIVKMDVPSTVKSILEGKVDFLSLDFTTEQGKEIALKCIDAIQIFALRLNAEDVAQRKVLKRWIEKDYKRLLLLDRAQRHAELINVYLEHKFQEQLQKWIDDKKPITGDLSIDRSYTEQQVITYKYATKEGEEICYFDNGLGIPVKLKTQAAFKFKITNAQCLVEKIDVELNRVNLGLVVNLINSAVHNCMRDVVLSTIEMQKLSYYDLPRFYTAIKDNLAEKLQAQFNDYGISVAGVNIIDISITNNITEKFEKEYYKFAELARKKEFENKLEAASLTLYEQKAMIHDKYPNFQMSLTEAEKDRALERYLERTGHKQELANLEVKQDNLGKRSKADDIFDTAAEFPVPQEPEAPIPTNKYRIMYGVIAAVLCVLGAVLTVLLNKQIMVGVGVVIAAAVWLVVMGVVWRYELRYGLSKKVKSDYDSKLQVYRKNIEEYDNNLKKAAEEKAEEK